MNCKIHGEQINFTFNCLSISCFRMLAFERASFERRNPMTGLQAEYSKLLETKRHNLATEALQKEQNQTSKYVAETGRLSAVETQRHDLATEALSKGDLDEKIRHQKAQDQENFLHNRNTESEIKRHNLAVEAQAQADNALKKAIAELDNATKLEVTDRQLANEQWKTRYTANVSKALNDANLAMQKYKTDTEALLKSNQLDLTKEQNNLRKQELFQQNKKINGDLEKIKEDIKNNAVYREIAQAVEKDNSVKRVIETENARRAGTLASAQTEKIKAETTKTQKEAAAIDNKMQADILKTNSETLKNLFGTFSGTLGAIARFI